MKKINQVQITRQSPAEETELPNAHGFYSKAGKNLRRILFLTCISVTGIVFTGCVGGYVATEPAYVQYERPPRPSNVHIWMDGDWDWSSHSHAYVQRAGYWERPRQNEVYVSGNWRSTPKGKAWSKGHWQKNNHGRRNGNRR